jgi:hypothetical protein
VVSHRESIEELRSQLAATNDEVEQAGLLDAIAPEDKGFIEKYLREEFPEGLVGVDLLLFQAGMLDKNLTPGFAVPPAAEETLLSAAEKWLAR